MHLTWPKTLMFSSFDEWVRDSMITNIIRDEFKNERMHSKYDRVDIIVLIVGLAGIISNQYSALRRMERMQRSLDELNTRIQEMNHHPKP